MENYFTLLKHLHNSGEWILLSSDMSGLVFYYQQHVITPLYHLYITPNKLEKAGTVADVVDHSAV